MGGWRRKKTPERPAAYRKTADTQHGQYGNRRMEQAAIAIGWIDPDGPGRRQSETAPPYGYPTEVPLYPGVAPAGGACFL